MGDLHKCCSLGVIICILILAVSATVSQKALNVALYETGRRWMSHWNLPVFTFLTDFTSVYTIVVYLALGYVLYKLYRVLFVPMNRIRYLGDIGYATDGDVKETVNRVRKQRIVGDLPPVYPNGWFGLIEGFKLEPGNALNITVLGKMHVEKNFSNPWGKILTDIMMNASKICRSPTLSIIHLYYVSSTYDLVLCCPTTI